MLSYSALSVQTKQTNSWFLKANFAHLTQQFGSVKKVTRQHLFLASFSWTQHFSKENNFSLFKICLHIRLLTHSPGPDLSTPPDSPLSLESWSSRSLESLKNFEAEKENNKDTEMCKLSTTLHKKSLDKQIRRLLCDSLGYSLHHTMGSGVHRRFWTLRSIMLLF